MAHEAGLLTNYVTNANITIEALDLIGPHLDAFRADLKGFSDETYKRIANIICLFGQCPGPSCGEHLLPGMW